MYFIFVFQSSYVFVFPQRSGRGGATLVSFTPTKLSLSDYAPFTQHFRFSQRFSRRVGWVAPSSAAVRGSPPSPARDLPNGRAHPYAFFSLPWGGSPAGSGQPGFFRPRDRTPHRPTQADVFSIVMVRTWTSMPTPNLFCLPAAITSPPGVRPGRPRPRIHPHTGAVLPRRQPQQARDQGSIIFVIFVS